MLGTMREWLVLGLLAALGGGCSEASDSPAAASPDAGQEPGTTPDAGGGPGIETAPDRTLGAFRPDRSWSYSMEIASDGQPAQPSRFTTVVEGRQTVDGRDALVVVSHYELGDRPLVSYVVAEGDDVLLRPLERPEWIPVLKTPVEQGASWTYDAFGALVTETWSFAGQVSVPAGTFEDCWRVDHHVADTVLPSEVDYTVYCRGVGKVVEEMRLDNGFSNRIELVSRDF